MHQGGTVIVGDLDEHVFDTTVGARGLCLHLFDVRVGFSVLG